ncbi:thioredoxin family protein [Campylobacter lari]|nr:thioredoxin family protein [Campylobacter lari]EAK0494211.1 thioredoxin family protein [Campylobacter lari]EAK9998092.1 thioredoxin family protein [Campylobacter lari]EAL0061428.1 thioredoxin family protein [Campylobacter lari]EFO9448532.1 thioredoxin family protein [Campylobacter lari]
MKLKHILSSFLLLSIICSNFYAKPIIYNDIFTAQQQALKEAKIMVFFVVSNTCKYCHKLLNDVMNNTTLMSYFDEKFVVAISDLNNGGKIPRDLLFDGTTPTTYIITPTGKVIGEPIKGAIDSNMLLGLLKGLEDYKKTRLGF